MGVRGSAGGGGGGGGAAVASGGPAGTTPVGEFFSRYGIRSRQVRELVGASWASLGQEDQDLLMSLDPQTRFTSRRVNPTGDRRDTWAGRSRVGARRDTGEVVSSQIELNSRIRGLPPEFIAGVVLHEGIHASPVRIGQTARPFGEREAITNSFRFVERGQARSLAAGRRNSYEGYTRFGISEAQYFGRLYPTAAESLATNWERTGFGGNVAMGRAMAWAARNPYASPSALPASVITGE